MNVIKKAYQYIYYKIYKFSESMPHPWWSDWKASSIMDILLIFVVITLCNYYNVFIDANSLFLSDELLIIVLSLMLIGFNYYMFAYKNKWKQIVEKFDELPKKKNRLGGWLVLVFVILVFANLFYSFYLYGQIDWSQYQ